MNERAIVLVFLGVSLACEQQLPTGAQIYGSFDEDGRAVRVIVNLRYASTEDRRAIPGRIEVDAVTFANEADAVIATAGDPLGCRAAGDVAAAQFDFGQFEARLPIQGECRRPPPGRTAFSRFVFRNEVATYHDFSAMPASLGGNGLAPGAAARVRARAAAATERARAPALRPYLEELAALIEVLPASHENVPACAPRPAPSELDRGALPVFSEASLRALIEVLGGGEADAPLLREADVLGDIYETSIYDLRRYLVEENREAPTEALAATFGAEHPRFRIVRVLEEEMPRYVSDGTRDGRRSVTYSVGRLSAVLFVVSRAERRVLCARSISVVEEESSGTFERGENASTVLSRMFRARVASAINDATPAAPE